MRSAPPSFLYGTDGKPTPTGSFSILEKDADHYSHSYDAPMPYMLRLTNDGVAIHGSNVREGYATHGCIGIPPNFARLLVRRGAQRRSGIHSSGACLTRRSPSWIQLSSIVLSLDRR